PLPAAISLTPDDARFAMVGGPARVPGLARLRGAGSASRRPVGWVVFRPTASIHPAPLNGRNSSHVPMTRRLPWCAHQRACRARLARGAEAPPPARSRLISPLEDSIEDIDDRRPAFLSGRG